MLIYASPCPFQSLWDEQGFDYQETIGVFVTAEMSGAEALPTLVGDAS
jgi:hypothetical protein